MRWAEQEDAAAAASRDIADVPAVEVITTAAVHLMSAAAVKVGLAGRPRSADGSGRGPRKLINALAGLITAGAPEISDMHAPLVARTVSARCRLAFREASGSSPTPSGRGRARSGPAPSPDAPPRSLSEHTETKRTPTRISPRFVSSVALLAQRPGQNRPRSLSERSETETHPPCASSPRFVSSLRSSLNDQDKNHPPVVERAQRDERTPTRSHRFRLALRSSLNDQQQQPAPPA